MKKWIIVMLTILTAVLVVGCGGTGTEDKAETKKETTKESKQANAVKKEVKEMKSNLDDVKKAIADKDKSALQSSAAELHKHWLEFENNVRDLYPLQYTDVEKYETPIFYESKNDSPNFDTLNDNATGLDGALDTLAKAKETKAKTSEVLDKAVDNYYKYVTDQVDEFVAQTEIFTNAVKSGDIEKAKATY
ncbi:Efem/EfeO family lipoprotein, partial [Listeria monocytogenes]|nr:Efem/EfeO family lipoprotein [Listeria monocytogenes]